MIVRGAEETHAADTLSFVGGKVDVEVNVNDVLETGLKREIMEETGVTVSECTYVHSTHFTTEDKDSVIDIVFLCRYDSGEPTIQDIGEVADIVWLTADEIRTHPKTPVWTKYTLGKVEETLLKLNW